VKSRWLLFILEIFFQQGFAQIQLEKQLAFAESLFAQEKYFDAITEAKRLSFFDSTDQYSFKANNLIAESYRQGGKLSEAVHYFTRAEISSHDKMELFSTKIEIIKINVLRRAFYLADHQLNELEKDQRFTAENSSLQYWRGWNYLFHDDWQKAAEVFGKIDSVATLKNICEEVQKKKYSVSFARGISIALPGAGQFYTGNYVSGILSLGWNVLFGYLTVQAFSAERIFDGMVVGTMLWLRFYNGNLSNAEKFAIEKNELIKNETLDYLQKNYQGLKP
jgi:TM2 domain-containing membrane protein YozV